MRRTIILITVILMGIVSCKKEEVHSNPKVNIFQCSGQYLTYKGKDYYLLSGYLKKNGDMYEAVYLDLDKNKQIIGEVFAKFPIKESIITSISNNIETSTGNPQYSKYSTCFLYKN